MDFGWQSSVGNCMSLKSGYSINPMIFCMCMSGRGERSHEGVLSTLFFLTESLTEPGSH